MTKQNRKLIGISEAAELLGVHQETLRNWEEDGSLPAVKTPGGHRRYRRDKIEAMVAGKQPMTQAVKHDEQSPTDAVGQLRKLLATGRYSCLAELIDRLYQTEVGRLQLL